MHRRLFYWEIFGILIIFVLGFVIHFGYEWLPKWKVLSGIFAVNESVWEHCKLTFWAPLLFAGIEWFFIRNQAHNFLAAKAAACYMACILMVMLFYTYSGIIGHNILIVDITIFGIAVAAGQWVSYRILTMERLPRGLNFITGLALILAIMLFYIYTFYPPQIPFFRDSETGRYGICK